MHESAFLVDMQSSTQNNAIICNERQFFNGLTCLMTCRKTVDCLAKILPVELIEIWGSFNIKALTQASQMKQTLIFKLKIEKRTIS
jgi:hypothetical protein